MKRRRGNSAGKSADKVCRGLLKRDVRIFQNNADGTYGGKVMLYDSKTDDRDRTVPLTNRLCRELLLLGRDKAPDDPIFSRSADVCNARRMSVANSSYPRS